MPAKRAFESRADAKKYTARDGDTLEAIAERESQAGNELSWQDIARFNWGAVDEDTANECLRDELGCRKRDGANRFVLSSDDEPGSELLIPVPFRADGLALEKTHTLRILRKVAPPQFLACCSIPGVTFEFDKSFVRPSVVDSLKKLEKKLADHPDARIIIFGHTDKVGSEVYNKQLSERRARSVFAFITDDADTWEALYNQENWGTRAIQEILADFGGEFDPGPVDGIYGSQTRQAVKNYQTARGLTVDGVAGPTTRKTMFSEYMTSKHDIELTPEQFIDPKHTGCGEFNPVEETEGPSEANRRVTFFLFHKDRPPKLPCVNGDLAPCRKQMDPPLPRFRDSFHCSFFDSIARKCRCQTLLETFQIRLFDELDNPLPGAPFVATTEDGEHSGKANSKAFITLKNVRVPTTCKVRWNHPGDTAAIVTPEEAGAPQFDYELDVFIDIEGNDSNEVVRRRLHNLGYSLGSTLNENVSAFQGDYGLDDNGDSSDPVMQAKLKDVHDSCEPQPFQEPDPPITTLFDDEEI